MNSGESTPLLRNLPASSRTRLSKAVQYGDTESSWHRPMDARARYLMLTRVRAPGDFECVQDLFLRDLFAAGK